MRNPHPLEQTPTVKRRDGMRARGKRGGERDFGFWILDRKRAARGAARFMAERKRNAEAAEAAERSAEVDRLGNYLELQRCWKLAPAYFPYSASISASALPPRFDSPPAYRNYICCIVFQMGAFPAAGWAPTAGPLSGTCSATEWASTQPDLLRWTNLPSKASGSTSDTEAA